MVDSCKPPVQAVGGGFRVFAAARADKMRRAIKPAGEMGFGLSAPALRARMRNRPASLPRPDANRAPAVAPRINENWVALHERGKAFSDWLPHIRRHSRS